MVNSTLRTPELELLIVPGFLGLPQEWGRLEEALKPLPHVCVNIVDWSLVAAHSKVDFHSWPAWLDRHYPRHTQRRVMLGYSMGGRLTLAYLASQSKVAGCPIDASILISTHPGLRTEEERQQRILSDELWALRFMDEDWNSLMAAWNQQAALAHSQVLPRSERDYSRQLLSHILRSFSLGHQPDFRAWLAGWRGPPTVHWWVGERDSKFVQLAGEVATIDADLEVTVFNGSGHRLVWDAFPELIYKLKLLLC